MVKGPCAPSGRELEHRLDLPATMLPTMGINSGDPPKAGQDSRLRDLKWTADVVREILEVIQEVWPGNATLTQMRIRSAILSETLTGRAVSVSDLSRELSLPDSTVSRAVLSLRAAGTVELISGAGDARIRSVRVRPSVLSSAQMLQFSERVSAVLLDAGEPD